jgi:hypothetical protein
VMVAFNVTDDAMRRHAELVERKAAAAHGA